MLLTLRGPVEADVELLHVVINEVHLVVGHQPMGNGRSPRRQRLPYTARKGRWMSTHSLMTSVSMRRLLGALWRAAVPCQYTPQRVGRHEYSSW